MIVRKIAALFVEADGCYAGQPDIDSWDITRDARLYAGPYPVVAHPPCERWGRYWSGGPSAKIRRRKGDDGGCFAAALAAVMRYGGVIEHPEASHAWQHFGIAKPPRSGGWIPIGIDGVTWTCCVEQGHYGHRARKATWLLVHGCAHPPDLVWGPSRDKMRLDCGYHSAYERRMAVGRVPLPRISRHERIATPIPFRDLLLILARDCNT